MAVKSIFCILAIAMAANADNIHLGRLCGLRKRCIPRTFILVISMVACLSCYVAGETVQRMRVHLPPILCLSAGIIAFCLLGIKLVVDATLEMSGQHAAQLNALSVDDMMFVGLSNLMSGLVVGLGAGLCRLNVLAVAAAMGGVCLLGLHMSGHLRMFYRLRRITLHVSALSGILLLLAEMFP